VGRRHALVDGVTNLVFEAKDVTELGTPGEYVLITAFDAVHDQARPGLRTPLKTMACR
jgi:hypothetical protein